MRPYRKPKIGLALGSGAARGWAHLGVLDVLEERGVQPEVVVGTSIGAVVGAAFAVGQLADFNDWVDKMDRREVAGYFDLSLRGGFIQARRVFNAMSRAIPDRPIEDIPVSFAAVATDLVTGQELWLREGSMYAALRASTALPGLVSPSHVDGRWLVDGGLVNPVPVSVCRALGADVVIAVDLNTTLIGRRGTSRSTDGNEGSGSSDASATKPRSVPALDSIRSAVQGFGTEIRQRLLNEDPGTPTGSPSIYDVVANSINIMQARVTRSRMAGDPPDIQIAPQLGEFGLLDFDKSEEAIAEGRRATVQALEGNTAALLE
jgi:NTE family protein